MEGWAEGGGSLAREGPLSSRTHRSTWRGLPFPLPLTPTPSFLHVPLLASCSLSVLFIAVPPVPVSCMDLLGLS